MSESHFVWQGSRVAFELGPYNLPFEVSIFGLLLAVAIYLAGFSFLRKRLNPDADKKRSKRKKEPEIQPPGWQLLLLAVGAFIGGQLVFALIPSPGFETFGPITAHWYGILFASTFLLGYALGSMMYKHAGFPQSDADALLIYIFVGTIAGARLGEVLFYNPGYYLMNPIEIPMIWKGGLASHGAFIGNILAMWLYVRKRPHITYVWVLDRMTIPFAIGGVFVRVGNFINSEIYGHPTDLPWGVAFPNALDLHTATEQLIPRHPSMLYEAFNGLILFIVLWSVYKFWKHRPPSGALLGLFMVILFTGRFIVEYSKVEQADFAVNWFVGMGQLLSIPLILIGLYILFFKVDWKNPSPDLSDKVKK